MLWPDCFHGEGSIPFMVERRFAAGFGQPTSEKKGARRCISELMPEGLTPSFELLYANLLIDLR